MKVNILEELQSSSGRFNDLVAQALRGEISGKSELVAAIDAISVADVNAVSLLEIFFDINSKETKKHIRITFFKLTEN